MAHHTRPPSSAVGDYLKAIWGAAGSGINHQGRGGPALYIEASVTKMFVRLREMGLVEYEPYQGASLTEDGLPKPCGWCAATA